MLLEERPDVGVGLLLLTKSVRAVFFFSLNISFFGWAGSQLQLADLLSSL